MQNSRRTSHRPKRLRGFRRPRRHLPLKQEKQPETQARYLLCEEVAGLLRLSPKTIYNMVYEGRIPCIRLSNKCVRFDRVEIEKWLKRKTQKDLTLS